MPEASDLHIDAALSNISVMYQNEAFVADKIMPRLPVKKESDKIIVYDKTLFRLFDTQRHDKHESNEIDWGLETPDTYSCETKALKGSVSQKERDNADPPIKPDIDTTEIVTNAVGLDREKRVADKVCTSANYSASHRITLGAGNRAHWDEYADANSDPLKDIDDAKGLVHDDTKLIANTILIPYPTARKLARHPNVIELLKYTHGDLVRSGKLPPTLLDLNVVLAGAGYASTEQGQTVTLSDVWGDYVWVGYVNPKVGLKMLTFGLSFVWKGRIVRKWHHDGRNCDLIEVEEQGITEKLIAKDCGVLLSDALA